MNAAPLSSACVGARRCPGGNAAIACRSSLSVPPSGRVVTICTADPLNLVGVVTAGDRLRPGSRNRVAYRDGVPVAVSEGEEFRALAPLSASETIDLARLLVRRVAARA